MDMLSNPYVPDACCTTGTSGQVSGDRAVHHCERPGVVNRGPPVCVVQCKGAIVHSQCSIVVDPTAVLTAHAVAGKCAAVHSQVTRIQYSTSTTIHRQASGDSHVGDRHRPGRDIEYAKIRGSHR